MSALPVRERAHRLLDLVPEGELPTVERMLRGLAQEAAAQVPPSYDPVLTALETAPEGDEELTPEDLEALQAGWRAKDEGRVVSHEEARRRLGL